jgi:hypothetical protein
LLGVDNWHRQLISRTPPVDVSPTILVKPNYHLFPSCEAVEDGGTAGGHCLPAEFKVGWVVDPGENVLAGNTRGCDARLESDAGNESPLYGMSCRGGQDSRGVGGLGK